MKNHGRKIKTESPTQQIKAMVATALTPWNRKPARIDIPVQGEPINEGRLAADATLVASLICWGAKLYGHVDRRAAWARCEKEMNSITDCYGLRVINVGLLEHAIRQDARLVERELKAYMKQHLQAPWVSPKYPSLQAAPAQPIYGSLFTELAG